MLVVSILEIVHCLRHEIAIPSDFGNTIVGCICYHKGDNQQAVSSCSNIKYRGYWRSTRIGEVVIANIRACHNYQSGASGQNSPGSNAAILTWYLARPLV